MKKIYLILTLVALFISLMFIHEPSSNVHSNENHALQFELAPYEHPYLGRNHHVYLPAIDRATLSEQLDFIEEVATYALEAQRNWGVPSSAIIGMAVIESGYGTTKTAYYARNLFGIKVWNGNATNAWQLKGQTDEDGGRVPIRANYGQDRLVYDETGRRNNWYRLFDSFHDSVNFLAGTLLVNDRYGFALKQYQKHIKLGWSHREASDEYLYQIAEAGYNHLGGAQYRQTIGAIIDRWDLTRYDMSLQGFTEFDHGFADALSIVPHANREKIPVLLQMSPDYLDEAVRTFITDHPIQHVTLVGVEMVNNSLMP